MCDLKGECRKENVGAVVVMVDEMETGWMQFEHLKAEMRLMFYRPEDPSGF